MVRLWFWATNYLLWFAQNPPQGTYILHRYRVNKRAVLITESKRKSNQFNYSRESAKYLHQTKVLWISFEPLFLCLLPPLRSVSVLCVCMSFINDPPGGTCQLFHYPRRYLHLITMWIPRRIHDYLMRSEIDWWIIFGRWKERIGALVNCPTINLLSLGL